MKTDSINETKSGQRLRNTSPIRQNARSSAGVAGAEGQKRADRPRVVQPGPGLNQDVTHHHAEPAKLDHDRLGGQLPPRTFCILTPSSIHSLLAWAHVVPRLKLRWSSVAKAVAFSVLIIDRLPLPEDCSSSNWPENWPD